MSTIVHINERGAFTIPKQLRDKYGLGSQVILEETADGLILRCSTSLPAEFLTEAHLAELKRTNAKAIPSPPLGIPAMIGFARRFHAEKKSTAEWMSELREGENE